MTVQHTIRDEIPSRDIGREEGSPGSNLKRRRHSFRSRTARVVELRRQFDPWFDPRKTTTERIISALAAALINLKIHLGLGHAQFPSHFCFTMVSLLFKFHRIPQYFYLLFWSNDTEVRWFKSIE